jgi:hypothetical protein
VQYVFGEERCIQGFGGKPGGKRPLAWLEYRCKNNIKINLPEVGWGNMDWIDLAQDGDVVMTLQVA